ncbi:hypothetical protein [Malaciobacter marinus]|uniref:hypothetical protein n=1 Tax=Malaciobacter marinus TaxID=505249 RepID=UPI003AFFEBD3
MKSLLVFVLSLAALLVFSGCSVASTAANVYEKGKKAYVIGEKVHDGLEKAGAGAKKAEEIYLKVKSRKKEE